MASSKSANQAQKQKQRARECKRERAGESAKSDKNFSISYAHNFIKQSQTDGRIVGRTEDRGTDGKTGKQTNRLTVIPHLQSSQ